MSDIARIHTQLVAEGIGVKTVRKDGATGVITVVLEDPSNLAHVIRAAALEASPPAPSLADRLATRGVTLREAALLKVMRSGAAAPAWALAEVRRLENEVDNA